MNWHKKELYPSALEIDMKFVKKYEVIIPKKFYSRAPWEKEVGLVTYESIERSIARPSSRKDFVGDEKMSTKMLLKRWEKF